MAIASTSWMPTVVHTLERIGYLTKFANEVNVIVIHDEGVLDCNKASAEKAFRKYHTMKPKPQPIRYILISAQYRLSAPPRIPIFRPET